MMLARRPWLVGVRAEQALGAACLVSLGAPERDGVWGVSGVLAGTGSLFLAAGVVYAVARSALFILLNAIV